MKWVERNELCGDPLDTFPDRKHWYILTTRGHHIGVHHGAVYHQDGVWMCIVAGGGHGYEAIPAVTSLEEAKAYVEALVRMQ